MGILTSSQLKRKRLSLTRVWLTAMGVILLFSSSLQAVEPDPLWDTFAKAKIRFQNDLAKRLLKSHPEFEGLILTYRDLQVVMAKMQSRKYYYLLKTDPDRLTRNQGAVQWSNFKWTEKDNAGLLGSDPEYAKLTKDKIRLENKNQGHPDWPALRDVFATFSKTQSYQEIHKALLDVISQIDGQLGKARYE